MPRSSAPWLSWYKRLPGAISWRALVLESSVLVVSQRTPHKIEKTAQLRRPRRSAAYSAFIGETGTGYSGSSDTSVPSRKASPTSSCGCTTTPSPATAASSSVGLAAFQMARMVGATAVALLM